MTISNHVRRASNEYSRMRTGLGMALSLVLALIGWVAPAMAQESHIKVSLVAESLTPAAGRATTIAVFMEPQPGWHGYWHTPGDTGLPPRLFWSLPQGVQAIEPQYPAPETLVIDGLMNHVYNKPYALLVRLDLEPNLARGTPLPLRLRMNYLACSLSACMPETALVTATLTVGDGAEDPATARHFAVWRDALPKPIQALAHFTNDKGRDKFTLRLPAAIVLENPHLFVDAPGVVAFAAPQVFARSGDELTIETAAAQGAAGSGGAPFPVVLTSQNGAAFEITAVHGVATTAAGTTGKEVENAGSERAPGSSHGTLFLTLVAFAGALVGGLLLNVMPCVFPILSLKALSLARSADDHSAAGAAEREALAYSAGVILVCVALGALIIALRAAGSEVGWAFQLQNPSVIFLLILLTSAIGFNLAGLFELASITAGGSMASRAGSVGAFWTGALAAFVATPCTGPFMAAALGTALVLPLGAALVVFFGLGLGLSLPFLAVGFSPAVRRALPKPGAWMAVFRHILAVPMFLTVLGLSWVIGNQTGADGIIVSMSAVLLLTLGLWVTGLRQRAFRERAWLPSALCLLLALGTVELLPAPVAGSNRAAAASASGPVRFDAQRLASLRSEGKPVFLYLTADWCLTCKVNEMTAIDRPNTQAAFARAGVVTMVGDWTDGDAAIGKFLRLQGRSGVPLYLWYAPGHGAKVLPQVLTTRLLIGLTHD